MAWVAPPTFVSGNALTAAQLNILSGDLNETAPAKATAAGQLFVSTAANTIVARAPALDEVTGGAQNTSSTAYTDLTTNGPAVTVTTGTKAIIMVGSSQSNSTSGANAYTAYAVSGATTIAASDASAFFFTTAAVSQTVSASKVFMEEALTAGSNIFTVKYRVSAGTGSWNNRDLVVIPL